MGALITVLIVGAVVLQVRWSSLAKRTTSVRPHLKPDEALTVVERAFNGASWPKTTGPGMVNRRLRTPIYAGPVVSVDIETDDRGTRVDVWMSAWSGPFGVANYGVLALLKKRKVLKAVENAGFMKAGIRQT